MPWTDGAPAVRVRFHCFFSCSSKSERPTARRAAEEEHVGDRVVAAAAPHREARAEAGGIDPARLRRRVVLARFVEFAVASHKTRLAPPLAVGLTRGGVPRPPREGTACAGERADGDTEEAASALDGAERALEAMRLLGAELEDEAGDAEAAIGSGSFEEDASFAAASRDETMPTSRSGGGGDAPAVRERASVVASASGAGLPPSSSAPEAEPPRGADIPGTGPSSPALPRKRARPQLPAPRARAPRADGRGGDHAAVGERGEES